MLTKFYYSADCNLYLNTSYRSSTFEQFFTNLTLGKTKLLSLFDLKHCSVLNQGR